MRGRDMTHLCGVGLVSIVVSCVVSVGVLCVVSIGVSCVVSVGVSCVQVPPHGSSHGGQRRPGPVPVPAG
jgi:hypothetical protein